ncbi:Bug family tripartite tricarboxylate transporter substrate binding protein [Ramlibacter sp. PS4R-6]|uniref:Bug family tripartite tricarboxylate transporter substrate binding protein n=1 Tax=Ramlibacter sp. PS4R-6 TaxID=3133438 RepID=UPI0030A13C43
MRRQQFLHGMAALALAGGLPFSARAASTLKMMIPANPGGGWDTTGRALGRALVEAGAADAVQYENKGGAAGVLGLAQFAQGAKGDPQALMMMGAVMVGGLITAKPPVQLQSCTPVARLTSEYNVFVVPAASPLRSMKDVVEQLKREPASVRWGGGSRGATEHIAACMLARNVGVDPKKVNYVAFRGGGEAVSAILGGNVTVGGSGYSEFAEHIAAGKMRAIGVTSQKRLPGLAVPTLKEQGWDVVIGNWRGVYGAPGISGEQRAELADSVVKATRTKAWQEALAKNGWTPSLSTGKDFEDFVEYEFSSLRAIMYLSGML